MIPVNTDGTGHVGKTIIRTGRGSRCANLFLTRVVNHTLLFVTNAVPASCTSIYHKRKIILGEILYG